MILHAHKLRESMLLGHVLHPRELRRPHTTCSDIAYFAALDEVVERFHRFFDGNVGVETVDLEEVDVRCVETGEGCVDCGEDCLTGQAFAVL